MSIERKIIVELSGDRKVIVKCEKNKKTNVQRQTNEVIGCCVVNSAETNEQLCRAVLEVPGVTDVEVLVGVIELDPLSNN